MKAPWLYDTPLLGGSTVVGLYISLESVRGFMVDVMLRTMWRGSGNQSFTQSLCFTPKWRSCKSVRKSKEALFKNDISSSNNWLA